MVDLNQNLPIITLSKNDLNIPIRRQILSEYIFKPIIQLHAIYKKFIKNKKKRKGIQCKRYKKVIVLYQYQTKKYFRDEKITESHPPEEIATLSVYLTRELQNT